MTGLQPATAQQNVVCPESHPFDFHFDTGSNGGAGRPPRDPASSDLRGEGVGPRRGAGELSAAAHLCLRHTIRSARPNNRSGPGDGTGWRRQGRLCLLVEVQS
jgi:hypothetical protein